MICIRKRAAERLYTLDKTAIYYIYVLLAKKKQILPSPPFVKTLETFAWCARESFSVLPSIISIFQNEAVTRYKLSFDALTHVPLLTYGPEHRKS